MTQLLVTVGLVTWNSQEFLRDCLDSLKKQEINLELIVIDNNSQDDSLSIVRSILPSAHIIENRQNLGFCRAHNQAIAIAKGEYYLALNPDICLETGYIQNLINVIETDPEYGMAAGKLYLITKNEEQYLDSTGLYIDRKRRQYLRGFMEIDIGQFNKVEEVFGVDGAAPLYRKKMLEDIRIFGEYFDELFFAHKEDVDISWRARLFGWRCVYTPFALAYHHRTFRPGIRAHLSEEIRFHAVKNRYLLMLKNEFLLGFFRDGFRILLYDFMILSYMVVRERSSLKWFYFIWRNRKRIFEWRKQIQLKVRVKPREFIKWFS